MPGPSALHAGIDSNDATPALRATPAHLPAPPAPAPCGSASRAAAAIAAIALALGLPSIAKGQETFTLAPLSLDVLDGAPAGAKEEPAHKHKEPTDIYLKDFFRTGWDDEWTHRPHTPGRAPRMALLKVQTDFLEREIRFDWADTYTSIRNKKVQEKAVLDSLLAWGFNRRLMLEVKGFQEWDTLRPTKGVGPGPQGGASAFISRLQLTDAYRSSLSFNSSVQTPNSAVGETKTQILLALAGFQDLSHITGLDRFALYWDTRWDIFAGPQAKAGDKAHDLTFDLTFAKTLSSATRPWFADFTPFVELLAVRDEDGFTQGRTLMTATPGARFNLHKGHWFLVGVDLPMTGPAQIDETYRVTYIKNFD